MVSRSLFLSVLVVLTLAILPHALHLPPWILLLTSCTAAWRLIVELKNWALPHRYLRIIVALSAMLGVLLTYRTLNGLEAGTALLTLMAGIKLLETQRTRDYAVLLFLAYFL